MKITDITNYVYNEEESPVPCTSGTVVFLEYLKTNKSKCNINQDMFQNLTTETISRQLYPILTDCRFCRPYWPCNRRDQWNRVCVFLRWYSPSTWCTAQKQGRGWTPLSVTTDYRAYKAHTSYWIILFITYTYCLNRILSLTDKRLMFYM